jgi:hypothetical protein
MPSIDCLLNDPSIINKKNFYNLQKSQRLNVEKNIMNLLQNEKLTNYLESYNLQVNKIEFCKKDFESKAECIFKTNQLSANQEEVDLLERVSFAKEKSYMADESYTAFREETRSFEWPTIHYIKLERKRIDDSIPKIYSNQFGVFYDAEDKINWIINIRKIKFKEDVVRICLRGDKTKVGTSQSFFNFCFSFPEETDFCRTASGQYTLGIFEVKNDNYEVMNVALNDLILSLKKIKFLKNTNKSIEWHLSFDMAFMEIERGLTGCSSNYSCFKCELHKNEFEEYNAAKIYNQNYSDVLRTLEKSNRKMGSLGYKNKPIFDFIEFRLCHHDTLHEKLRIVTHILGLVFHQIQVYDLRNFKDSNDLSSLPEQKKFHDFLIEIGVKNPYVKKNQHSNQGDSNFILKTFFTGIECENISKYMNRSVISCLENCDEIALLFNNYYRIHMNYKHNFYIDKLELLQQNLDSWKATFNKNFPLKRNTPYIHFFTDHLVNSIKIFGDVDLYNIQG